MSGSAAHAPKSEPHAQRLIARLGLLRFVLRLREEFHTIRRLVIMSSPRSPLFPFVSSTEFIESIWNSPLRFSSALRGRQRGQDMSAAMRRGLAQSGS